MDDCGDATTILEREEKQRRLEIVQQEFARRRKVSLFEVASLKRYSNLTAATWIYLIWYRIFQKSVLL